MFHDSWRHPSNKYYTDWERQMELTFMPLRLQSHIVGFIAHIEVPKDLRYVLWGIFVEYEGIDMSTAIDQDFGNYPTLSAFFGRKLKPDIRPIDQPTNCSLIASPSDGHILNIGEINQENFTFDCVKGRSYRLDEFMLGVKGDGEVSPKEGPEPPINSGVKAMVDKVKARGNKLMFAAIYLSPADYHHFNSPVCHTADYRRHIAGNLTLVRGSYSIQHPDTYKTNERVSIFGRWEQGFYFESPIGATNVGSVILHFDDTLETDAFSPPYPFYYDRSYGNTTDQPFTKYLNTTSFEPLDTSVPHFKKGVETGMFDLGSSYLIMFEALP